MMFLKFMRVLAAVAVAWLLWRLLLLQGRKRSRAGSTRTDRRNKPHRKFVQSSVVEDNDHAKENRSG